MFQALVLKSKTLDPFVWSKEVPFGCIAMLKNSPARKIVLTHCSLQMMDSVRNERVFVSYFSKGKMKRFFVAVDVLVIEFGILVEPEREIQGAPTFLLIHNDLAALKFRFKRNAQPATPPDRKSFFCFWMVEIGQKYCP